MSKLARIVVPKLRFKYDDYELHASPIGTVALIFHECSMVAWCRAEGYEPEYTDQVSFTLLSSMPEWPELHELCNINGW